MNGIPESDAARTQHLNNPDDRKTETFLRPAAPIETSAERGVVAESRRHGVPWPIVVAVALAMLVLGTTAQPVYNWLAHSGTANAPVWQESQSFRNAIGSGHQYTPVPTYKRASLDLLVCGIAKGDRGSETIITSPPSPIEVLPEQAATVNRVVKVGGWYIFRVTVVFITNGLPTLDSSGAPKTFDVKTNLLVSVEPYPPTTTQAGKPRSASPYPSGSGSCG
jgi:hypothetical protein